MAYGIDKWLMPIDVTSESNSFRIFEDGVAGEIIETVSAGTYYLHDSNNADYPGLLYEIRTAVSAAATDTYTWEAVAPTDSYQQAGGGLRLVGQTSGFTIDFGDVDFTMDPRWFGQTSSDSYMSTADPSGNYFVDSRLTCYGQWLSYCEGGGQASNKTSRPVRDSRRSHARPEDAYSVTWARDEMRTMVYEYVPAGHVFESRLTGDVDAEVYAAVAKLGPNDNHNAFETIWDNGLRKLRPVLIIHDDGDRRVDLGGNWDAVRLTDEGRMQNFAAMYRLMRTGGEYYKIDCGDLYLESKGYSH